MKALLGRSLVLLAAVLAIATVSSAQGLYWESTSAGGPLGDSAMVSKTYAIPRMYKHISEKGTMILRMDQEKVYSLDPEKKTYWVMTFSQIEDLAKKAGAKMDEARAKMQEKMKNMSDEQRKMMEQMMQGMTQGPKEAKLEVTGEKKSVSGHSCTKEVVTEDGKETATFWVTKDLKAFDAMRDDWKEFNKRILSMNRMTGMATAIQKLDGFPMETTMMEMTTTVTKVEKRATPASEFAIPVDYKQVDPPSFDRAPK